MANIEKLQREIEKLKAQVALVQERQNLQSKVMRLKQQKRTLSAKAHPGRKRFSDFVKAEYDKHVGKKLTFKKAVQLAKKAYGDV